MSTTHVDNPGKWLLAQLPDYLTPEQLESLMAAYETQKRRYYHAVKVHDAERRVRIHSTWPGSIGETRLAKWQARLAKLKAEWEAMEGTT